MKHDRGLCGCVPKASLPEDYVQTFSFCELAMLCASVASCQPPKLSAELLSCPLNIIVFACAHVQPFRLKMPKRDRDTDNGVWAVADSHSEDGSAMVTHPVPTPPAGATQPDSVAARCPYPACALCAWKVPPHQHTCYVTVYAAYKILIKTLEEEPELTLAIKCKQGQMLNWQLMTMERQLFENGSIKEDDPLGPLIYLRSGASAAGAWGMVSLPGLPPGCPAESRAAGSGEASAAAAGTGDDGAADGAGGGKKKRTKKKMTLASMDAFTQEEWVQWDKDYPRYEWEYTYEYDVKVKTDEGDAMQSYPDAAKRTLIDAYFSGQHRVDFSMTVTAGRHAGSTHDYVVYWIDANEGMQFNPQNPSAAVRKVVLTRTPWPVDNPTRWWNPESGQWEERRGW